MTRSVTHLALTLARVIAVTSACGCAFDTSPLHEPPSGLGAPRVPAVNPSAPNDAQGGIPDVPVGNPGEIPDPQEPLPGDSTAMDAAVASEPPDVGVTGVPADEEPQPDAGATVDDPDPSSSGLLDELREWIANSPRVAEAEALRRIMAALATPAGAPPDVKDAVNALGDVDCARNARTCIAVCSWAVVNCSYCAGDPSCVADMTQNCNRGCP